MKIVALSATLVALLTTPLLAQTYPEKDIDLVVPFDAGGSGDVTSRIIAETANTLLDGAKINVVNRAGGGGVVGRPSCPRPSPTVTRSSR